MMPRIPYGFETDPPDAADDPWTKLNTIREHLEDQQPLPPYLAQWLGQAVKHANRDPNELMRRLGLKLGRGRPSHKHPTDAWLTWGSRVCALEAEGLKPEEALTATLREGNDAFSRTQLQKWRDNYRSASA